MLKSKMLSSSLEGLRKYFLEEIIILKKMVGDNLQERGKEVRLLLASACTTGTAIHALGEQPEYFYSEMMMLARSFIEKLTNFCYLQVCDDIEYEKFLLHPFYRAFHNLNKSKYTPRGKMSIRYLRSKEMKKNAQVSKALSIFSDTNPGKSWSDLSIDQKVSVLSQKTKIQVELFLMNTLTIYSNASEALHGSLYGCALSTGVFVPGIDHANHEEVYENLYKNTALLYVQLGSMVDELIKLVCKDEVTAPQLHVSKENQKIALNLMNTIFTNNTKSASL